MGCDPDYKDRPPVSQAVPGNMAGPSCFLFTCSEMWTPNSQPQRTQQGYRQRIPWLSPATQTHTHAFTFVGQALPLRSQAHEQSADTDTRTPCRRAENTRYAHLAHCILWDVRHKHDLAGPRFLAEQGCVMKSGLHSRPGTRGVTLQPQDCTNKAAVHLPGANTHLLLSVFLWGWW